MVFHTIPIGPQLQAQQCSPVTAERFHYHEHHTQEIIEEITHNPECFLNAYNDVLLAQHILMLFVMQGSNQMTFSLSFLLMVHSSMKASPLTTESISGSSLNVLLRRLQEEECPPQLILGPNNPKFMESFDSITSLPSSVKAFQSGIPPIILFSHPTSYFLHVLMAPGYSV